MMLLPLVVSGCTQNACPTFAEADLAAVAARRAVEERDYPGQSADRLLEHATQVLLDLDCTLLERDSTLGLVSARGRRECVWGDAVRRLTPAAVSREGSQDIVAPICFSTCGGAQMMVTVTARDHGARIRVTPQDPDAKAAQAFHHLLSRSLEVGQEGAP